MKKLLLALLIPLSVNADGFDDKSKLGTPEVAKCAAAALKFDLETWKTWHSILHERYKIIYKDRMSTRQIEDYTIERVQDKKRELMKSGIDSRNAYRNYWKKNCKET